MTDALLSVKNLKTYFYNDEDVVKAVDGVGFKLTRGTTMGVVGESGCGKSVTALSIMGLVPQPPGKIVDGKIIFKDEDLLCKDKREMRKIRGNEIAMIFQEPMTSLNPVFTVGNQIIEAIRLHQEKNKRKAREKAVEMLKVVGIPSPELRIDEYPHQLSGGMRQRVMIAMALSCYPNLLIADEPTTALDVTIEAQIIDLLKNIQNDFGTSIMLITHDLGVIAETVEEVMVMYLGKVVERTGVSELFENTLHPYTKGLLNSIPKPQSEEELNVIEGVVPEANEIPEGCSFHPRCKLAEDKCINQKPKLKEVLDDHFVSCWVAEKNHHKFCC